MAATRRELVSNVIFVLFGAGPDRPSEPALRIKRSRRLEWRQGSHWKFDFHAVSIGHEVFALTRKFKALPGAMGDTPRGCAPRGKTSMNIRSVRGLVFGAAVAFAAAVAPVGAQSTDARVTEAMPAVTESVPRLVQFNGTLKDASARPVSGVASVTFAIYAEQDGGAALWAETQNVLADANGHYSALLGTSTSGGFPAELIGTGQSRWLGVSLARQEEAPRVLLASVPYALKAGDADTLGGLPASSYVTTQQLAARSTVPVFSGGSTIIATPGVAMAQASQAATPNSAQSSVIDATPTGSGTTDYIPLWTSGSNLGNSLLFQTGGKLGVGTTTPASTLDINGGQILRGGFYEYPQGTATASAGQPSHSFQWDASVFNSSTKAPVFEGFGFRAVPDQNDVASPTAKLDLFYGSGGPDGSLNDLGLSIDHTGYITFVSDQNFNGGAVNVSSLNLPPTTSAFSGVLRMGGVPVLSSYGDSSNIFLGSLSGGGGTATSAGNENAAVGQYSLYNLTSGTQNVAFGYSSLWTNTSGSYNVALGALSSEYNSTAWETTAVGYGALSNGTANGNTAVGALAGSAITSGSYNTMLGTGTSTSSGTLTYATAIGASAVAGESNSMILSGSGAAAVSVGIGTSTPGHTLDVASRGIGGANIYASSAVAGESEVYGINNATTGLSNGAYFTSNSPNGSGVVGQNEAGGYAAYFIGNVTVSGTLSKSAGSFKIDDPIDPANKYLSHSFVESPDMMNIYNGNVTTNAKGYATITLPEWFSALNRDFRYQLTVVGQFAQAIVANEINENRFTIRTNKPRVKVSWMVTGVRQDAWANAHRIPTEQEKPADEQGKYLHPELFGAGPDKAIGVGGAVNAQSQVPAAMPDPTPAASATSSIPGGH